MSCNQYMDCLGDTEPAPASPGNRMMLDAKIGGSRPPCSASAADAGSFAPVHLVADLALRVVHQDLALARSRTPRSRHQHHEDADEERAVKDAWPGAHQFEQPRSHRQPAAIPAKMIIEMPLPMPRSVICSPSHIRNIVPVTSVATVTKRNMSPARGPRQPVLPARSRCPGMEQREP